ncbi:galactokinase family protein [candidate division KSB1 bacterium]
MGGAVTIARAPGRICLFGEHQDYLGLPIIAMAIDLEITVRAQARDDMRFELDLPDVNKQDAFTAQAEVDYIEERDYIRSAVNICLREGARWESGYDIDIHGTIPINSGTSSSSALIIAWTKLLLALAGDERSGDPGFIARLGHRGEVLEFQEPGGMMDHFSSSVGGVIFLETQEPYKFTRFAPELGSFVLGDSLEPKETKNILARVKGGALEGAARLKEIDPSFDLQTTGIEEGRTLIVNLPPGMRRVVAGNLVNRDILQTAKTMFEADDIDHRELGRLLDEHHSVLRDDLDISTPKIERMLAAAKSKGAYGGKINGSGGGGAMFVYAPENTDAVAAAMEAEGGKSYVIKMGEGARIETG